MRTRQKAWHCKLPKPEEEGLSSRNIWKCRACRNSDRNANTCPSRKIRFFQRPVAFRPMPSILNELVGLLSSDKCIRQCLPLSAKEDCLYVTSRGQRERGLGCDMDTLPTSSELIRRLMKTYWVAHSTGVPPSLLGGHILRPQQVPETTDSTEPYIYCFFLYTHTMKFNV